MIIIRNIPGKEVILPLIGKIPRVLVCLVSTFPNRGMRITVCLALEWIEKLRPKVVLLSVGGGDREGRPDVETLEALEGYTLLRTDRDGWIELTTDGEQLWVGVERQ